ncbi:hypothetical protein [Aquiflexum gelatinilyticum]|uniref:Uncharacterized protein n=1 Tax=Aquiflexum gelatinilyticum TaxID=2961943 RepID=A0A9X2P4T0_9BACT|nr:hypothetical protein [Aquiflexum gelatinilyticum]MCR9015307.1 hypothetical protein [Aquiflexum gelatinilyticum]MCS4435352.1 hypothetical protein [Aquiflexum gelatinilyticum]
METQTENPPQNPIPSGSVYGVFKNHKDSKETISLILDRGYELDEIEVNPPDMGYIIPTPTSNHHPSGDEFMKEAIKSLKIGLIIGFVLSAVSVGLYFLINGDFEDGISLFTINSAIIVGTIWGGMMGFFVGPHLPSPIWSLFYSSPKENNVTVNFQAHNMVDVIYFAEKGRLKVAQ